MQTSASGAPENFVSQGINFSSRRHSNDVGASRRKEITMKNVLIGLSMAVMLSGCDADEAHSPEQNAMLQVDAALSEGQEVTTGTSNLAQFEEREIDLARDWEGASACVVWRSGGIAQCFRSSLEAQELVEEIAASSGALERTSAPHPAESCSRTCLHIYEHTNFGGRELHFCDRGYWQNLTSYGFNDMLSSYKTGVHSAHLAEHTNGAGYWYPGNTGICVSGGGMSSGWNDRISSIYIN